MADSTAKLLLTIDASVELLKQNLRAGDAQVAQFERDTAKRLSAMDRAFASFGKGVGGVNKQFATLRTAGASLGIAFSIQQLGALGNRALQHAASLGEVSRQLGVTTKDLQVYRYAASQVGVEQEVMDKGLAKLTLSIGKAQAGSKPVIAAFQAIGISVKDLKNATAGDVLPKMADGLAKIGSDGGKAAVGAAIMGKNFQQLMPLFDGGSKGIQEYARAAKELGLVLSDEQIQNADATADKLGTLKKVLEAQITGVVSQNANSILVLASSFTNLAAGIIKFLASNPERAYAIMFGLAGFAVGGPIGAAAGALAGAAYGANTSESGLRGRLQSNAKNLRQQYASNSQNYEQGLRDYDAGRFDRNVIKKPGVKSYIDERRELRSSLKLVTGGGPIAVANTPTGEVPDFLATGSGGGGGKEDKTTRFIDPVSGPITSGYGLRKRPMAGASTFHKGIDFGVPVGTSVKAPAAGVVVKTGKAGGLGQVVWIDHGNNTISELSHLSTALVKPGDVVDQGQVVAKSGNTGTSTGPHLDYRIKVGGKYVDPTKRKFATDIGDAAGNAEEIAARAAEEAEQARKEKLRRDFQAAADERRGQTDLLRAQQDLAADYVDRTRLALDILEIERQQEAAAITHAVAMGESTVAEADKKLATLGHVTALKRTKILADEELQRAEEYARVDAALAELEREKLEREVASATTAKARRAAELRLLDHIQEQERIALQAVLDSKASEEDKAVARRKLDTLPEKRRTDEAEVKAGTRGPIEEMRSRIPKTADEINEALEGVAAQGLTSLTDGITDAIMGAKSLGDVFKAVAKQIIADLIRIAVQRAIIAPLLDALFPGSSGGDAQSGSGGGIAGAIGGLFRTVFKGGRATGGPVTRNDLYMVGERGPELFVPSVSGRIIANDNLRRANGQAAGGSSLHLTVNAPGATAETVAMIRREMANAAPMLIEASTRATGRQMSRPRL